MTALTRAMISRLVIPLVFLIGLAALFFTLQTLSSATNNPTATSTGSDLLKQYQINPIAPIVATVTDGSGQKIDLPSLLTKPTLLTFWSAGCGECETLLPLLDSAKSQPGLTQVIVDVKDAPADAQAKLTSLKVDLPTYYDRDGSASQAWEATMPSSYYIANDQVTYFFPGRISQDILDALVALTK